jgi:predicted metallopeptidase
MSAPSIDHQLLTSARLSENFCHKPIGRGVLQIEAAFSLLSFRRGEKFMEKIPATMAQRLSTRSFQIRQRILATILLSFSIFFALGAAAGGVTARSAQETFSGTWTAEVKRDNRDDRIQFSFHRRTERDNMSTSGSDISLNSFQGLTREQVFAAANTSVSFRLVREAGTIECEGSFRDGKGAGSWRLIPSQSFRSAMSGRGYDNLTDEQVFTSAMVDITSKFVDDFKSIGFARPTFKDVIKGRIFNVTPQFVAEMKSLGFDNLDLEEIVKARIFKIDTEFVRQVQAMGFERQSLEGLVKLRIFKITPEFISAMKSAEFENLSAEALVKLRIFEITPAFVKGLKAEGLSQISVEDAVKLRIHHVDEDFIRRAKASGYTDLSVEELVRLSIHGKVK